jgi:hypothetical protein
MFCKTEKKSENNSAVVFRFFFCRRVEKIYFFFVLKPKERLGALRVHQRHPKLLTSCHRRPSVVTMKFFALFALLLVAASSCAALSTSPRPPPYVAVGSNSNTYVLCPDGNGNYYGSFGISELGPNADPSTATATAPFGGLAIYKYDLNDVAGTLTGAWYEPSTGVSNNYGWGSGPETITSRYVIDDSTAYPTAYLELNRTWSFSGPKNAPEHMESMTAVQATKSMASYCLAPADPTTTLVGQWFGGDSLHGSGYFYICSQQTTENQNTLLYGSANFGNTDAASYWYFQGFSPDNGLTVIGSWIGPDGAWGDIVLSATNTDVISGWVTDGNSYNADTDTYLVSFSRQGDGQSTPRQCAMGQAEFADQKPFVGTGIQIGTTDPNGHKIYWQDLRVSRDRNLYRRDQAAYGN